MTNNRKSNGQKITRAMEDLIQLVRAFEAAEGEPVGKLEASLDVKLASGKMEKWTIIVGREAPGEM